MIISRTVSKDGFSCCHRGYGLLKVERPAVKTTPDLKKYRNLKKLVQIFVTRIVFIIFALDNLVPNPLKSIKHEKHIKV